MYLLSNLSMKYKVVIDMCISCPGHGGSRIDGINAADKSFICQQGQQSKLQMTQTMHDTWMLLSALILQKTMYQSLFLQKNMYAFAL